MTATESPVVAFGQLPVDAVHSHRKESVDKGLSASTLLLPSRTKSSSKGMVREVPPSTKTSGARRSVVKLADEVMVKD